MKSHYCFNIIRLSFEKPCSADLDRSNWGHSLRVHAKWRCFCHLLTLPLMSSNFIQLCSLAGIPFHMHVYMHMTGRRHLCYVLFCWWLHPQHSLLFKLVVSASSELSFCCKICVLKHTLRID